MKNNFFKIKKLILVKCLMYFLLSITSVYGNQIDFTAETIETIDENTFKASKDIKITSEEGIVIYGDELRGDNKDRIYTIEKNVIVNDNINNIQFKSNKIIYNQTLNVIKSLGLTEIFKQENFTLTSSDVTFDKKNEIIFSENESVIKDNNFNSLKVKDFFISLEKNTVMATSGILIDKDLNEIEIKNINFNLESKEILGKDISVNQNNNIEKEYMPRMKGRAFFYDENKSEFEKTVYTNCEKRDGCPPWLLQAEKITHDRNKRTINYKNSLLKIYDIPVFYFPKFFHPDPSVKRQSGFLIPNYTQSSSSGNYLNLPYFFVISENRDFTLSPRFYDNNKTLYQGEYRHLTKNSENILDLSIKNDSFALLDDNSSETHLFLNSSIKNVSKLFDFSELKLQIQSTSSDNYLKSYNIKSPIINSQTVLNSNILFEGSSDDINFSISSEVYEDLTKTNNNDKYEFIYPNYNITKELQSEFNGNLKCFNKWYFL